MTLPTERLKPMKYPHSAPCNVPSNTDTSLGARSRMSYNHVFEASKALPLERIAKELEDFAATGQDLSQRRFSRSPPRVSSVPSTKYEESESPSPGTILRDKECREIGNSTAGHQYRVQIEHEIDRIRAARCMGLLQQPVIHDWEEAAEANVRYRWVQQGLWDERWDDQAYKIWKHESQDSLPPEQASFFVKDTVVSDLGLRRRRPQKDLEDEYQEAVKFAVEHESRQSSRPCYQFVYQLCEERQWIKMGLSNAIQGADVDIDTRAYESVKSRWIRDGIWEDDWNLIPGVSWRHERPPKFPFRGEIFRQSDAYKAARMEEAERPPKWYFMAPEKPPIIYRPRLRSPGSSERVSDQSGSSIPDAILQVMPPRRHDSVTLRETKQVDLSTSTGQSIATAKQNTKSGEHDERLRKPSAQKAIARFRTTKRKGTSTQKKQGDTPRSFTTRIRSVEKRSPINQGKHEPSTQSAKKRKSVTSARSSRPRRAAASKALKKLKTATQA